MPALVTTLTLEKRDFTTPAEGARVEMEKLKVAVGQVNAELVVNQREARAAGGGTDVQITKINELKTQLKSLQSELRTTKADYKILSEAPALLPPAPPKPSSYISTTGERQSTQALRQAATASLAAEYRQTEEELAAVRARRNAQSGDGEGGGENTRMASMEAGHSVRSIFSMMGAGQDFSAAATAELPRLLQASGKGLGSIIAIEAAAGIIEGVNKALERVRELRKEFADVMGGGGTSTTSQGALHSNIDELAATREKLTVDPNKWMRLDEQVLGYAKAGLAKATGQKTEAQEDDDRIEQLERRRIELSTELARRKTEEVALDQRAAAEGEDSVAADRERLALRERIAAVQDDKNIDATAQEKIIEGLRKESALRQDIIRQIQEKAEAERSAAEADAYERSKGTETPVNKAQHALQAAQDTLESIVRTKGEDSPEYRDQQTVVTNRKSDLNAAEQHQLVDRQKQVDDTVLAGEGGSNAQRERRRLQIEQSEVASQLDPFSDKYQIDKKEQRKLRVRQAQLAGQSRDMDYGDSQRGLDTRESAIQANAGRGSEARLATLREEIQLLNDRNKLITDHAATEGRPLGSDENLRIENNVAQAHKLREEMIGVRAEETERLATIQAQTMAIEQQGYQLTAAQKKQAIANQYQRQIDKDNLDNDPAAAAAHARERDAAETNVDIDEAEMTPAQKRARNRANLRRQQAAERVAQRQKNHAEVEAANNPSASFDAFFNKQTGPKVVNPVLPPKVINPADAAHKDAATAGFKGVMGTTESLLTKIQGTLDTKLDLKER